MALSAWHILVLGMVLIVAGIPVADATPPPYEGRAWYLLPQPAAPYYNESNNLGFIDVTPPVYAEKPTRLPWLSNYHAFGNYTHKESGTMYVAEIWYYHDWESFQTDRDFLVSYLGKQGKVTPVTLDLSNEYANTNDPSISALRTRQVNATRYISGTTSGYFIIVSTDFFPGDNYYIAYYGTERGSDLLEDTPRLKALILSVFPGFVEHTEYAFDPVAPKTTVALPATLCVAALLLLAAAIAVWITRASR